MLVRWMSYGDDGYTTVGYQSIPPHSILPCQATTSFDVFFQPGKRTYINGVPIGVYISEGCGFFESQSFKRKKD